MKISIIIILSLISGILIGKYTFATHDVVIRSETIAMKSGKEKQLDKLSEAFYNLSKTEFEDYVHLKNQKEKFEKAEEILGKVILLFLANVQMKMGEDVKDYFTSGKRVQPNNEVVKGASKEVRSTEVIINDYIKSKNIKDLDVRFKDIQRKFPIELSAPSLFFKNAKPIKDINQIDIFNGSFKGELNIISGNKKGEVHGVDLRINFQDNNGKVSGSYESKLSSKGNLYSHNKGNGTNGQIKRSKGRGLFLLETSPNSFLHLKYLSGEDYFIGKYYVSDEYRGLVMLYPIR